jgi:hypothetical protein
VEAGVCWASRVVGLHEHQKIKFSVFKVLDMFYLKTISSKMNCGHASGNMASRKLLGERGGVGGWAGDKQKR